MIAHLKPYPVMKDSGVVWLGEVPKGWDVLRGRQLFEIKKRISGELGHAVISVTKEGLRVKDVESGEGQLSQDYSKYQTVGVGEFAMNSMDLLTGGVGIATSPGVTSPDYRVFAVRDKCVYCDRYMLHVLRMLYRNRGFYAWGQGSAQLGRWRLPRRRFNDFPFPVPSFTEQAAVARFLDWTNGRLERTIRAKRKVIALLSEQKQAIIHRAVTRGLDPSVPLKSSGIPWLGDIPQHWEAKRLKAIAQIRYGLGQPPRETETGLPLIRATNVDQGRILEKNLVRVDPADVPKSRNAFLKAGEIIVVRSGALTADSAIIPKEYEGAVAGYDMVVTVKRGHPEFIAIALLSSYVQADQLVIASMRAAQPHLNAEELGTAIFMVPPDEEQKQIVEFVRNESFPIDAASSCLEREIDLLREYRTRLVADVVTGKLDVREAAARLPAEAPLDATEDEAELTDEADAP